MAKPKGNLINFLKNENFFLGASATEIKTFFEKETQL
jgi:hypothetical protein